MQQSDIQRHDDIENGCTVMEMATQVNKIMNLIQFYFGLNFRSLFLFYSQCAPDLQASIDDSPTRLMIKPQLVFQRKHPASTINESTVDICTYLDLAEKQDCVRASAPILLQKPNDLFPSLCRKEPTDSDNIIVKSLADVVTIPMKPKFISPSSSCSHQFIPNGNQDLAEADQICNENNANATTPTTDILRPEPLHPIQKSSMPSDNEINDDVSGAIGGIIETPILPDLAKVIERDDNSYNK